ncbi:hypothetical protein ACFQLX_10835 [Streptomyces polyrhachis]|uniref:Peptidase inhibitor family I36 n=1 Tax=Streptomyces polyrhachis TaxID=1282885 RepID=A0ABW2GGH7_9ACTN
MHIRKLIAATAVMAGAVAGTLATASPASAAALRYDCRNNGEACLYYNSSTYGFGAYFKQTWDVSSYAGFYFKSGAKGGAGAGVEVKNNAAAVDNNTPARFRVYYNSNWSCSFACQTFNEYSWGNLNPTMKNNNASGRVVG